jgi:hypothetical protein
MLHESRPLPARQGRVSVSGGSTISSCYKARHIEDSGICGPVEQIGVYIDPGYKARHIEDSSI